MISLTGGLFSYGLGGYTFALGFTYAGFTSTFGSTLGSTLGLRMDGSVGFTGWVG